MAEHTPGEWEIIKGGYNFTDDLSVWPKGARGDGDKRIACWIRTIEDAHLIAAAPNLLAACKEAIEEARERDEDLGCNCWPTLLAAIAKAEGVDPHDP